jgi:hypothetical protein
MVQFRPAVPRRFRIHLTQLTLASVSAPLKRTTRTSGLNTVENLRPRERGCVGSISLRGSSSSCRAAQPEHRQLLFCQANRPGCGHFVSRLGNSWRYRRRASGLPVPLHATGPSRRGLSQPLIRSVCWETRPGTSRVTGVFADTGCLGSCSIAEEAVTRRVPAPRWRALDVFEDCHAA